MSVIIFDCEANGFVPQATKLWVIGTKDYDTGEYKDYVGEDIPQGVLTLSQADCLIGHNILGYDIPLLEKLSGQKFDTSKCIDTLVASRLLYGKKFGTYHHGLADWGKRLDFPKGDFKNFLNYSEEMRLYCQNDVELTSKVYKYLEGDLANFMQPLMLEQGVHRIIEQQVRNGFYFDVEAAEVLKQTLADEVKSFSEGLQLVFPPAIKRLGHRQVRTNRSNKEYTQFASYEAIEINPFNPDSRDDLVERFTSMGWVPEKHTETTGKPQLTDEVLEILPYEEAVLSRVYFDKSRQLAMLATGNQAWLNYVGEDQKIHGRVNPLGAATTSRMSHYQPNVAQAHKGSGMRALFKASPGRVLVGCDADALEARAEAAYLEPFDHGAAINILINGDKKLGTDLHSLNQKAMGFYSRDNAKTLCYALMYGAGDEKLGVTVMKDIIESGRNTNHSLRELGRDARQKLMKNKIGSEELLASINEEFTNRGYILGLDGRHLFPKGSHTALNTLLQSAGAILMKTAQVILDNWLQQYGLDAGFCATIHDEFVLDCLPDHAEEVALLSAKSIAQSGIDLGLACPFKGNSVIGITWAEIH